MLAGVLRGTAVARAAVAGLAVGLAALAGLALWSTDNNIRTTAWVRSSDEVSAYWSKTFLSLSIEGEALNDYVLADSDLGRKPLKSAVGSAGPTMDWLVANGTPADRAAARSAQETYRSYTEMLREFLQAANGRDRAQAALDAAPVSMIVSTLQKQAITNMTRKRMESNAYLTTVEAGNQQLRLAEAVIGGVDLLLLALCAVLLLSHQRRIEHQAVCDALTGLANRVLLGRRVQQALRAADRHGDSVGLLLLDLNGFKDVNDTLGHHAGDLLLQHVAGRLLGAVRDRDTVARLGGDEFAVVLPRMSSVTDVELIAERLLTALQIPADLDGQAVDVRVSIGAAVYPLQSADADDLMQHADTAMYEAKRRQSGTALYDPTAAPPPGSVAPAVVGELSHALQQRELMVHYPPPARPDGGFRDSGPLPQRLSGVDDERVRPV